MRLPASLLLPAVLWAGAACGQSNSGEGENSGSLAADSISDPVTDSCVLPENGDTLAVASDSLKVKWAMPDGDESSRYTKLTDADFAVVAKELNVEIAAIKAVVEIEAGKTMHGFFIPGVPVINFDASMYRTYASKAPDRAPFKSIKVPSGLTGYGLKEWTQLVNACKKNGQGALMGTFWGMFQIGGFNYKLCDCTTVVEFARQMAESEFAQLELFARFITNTGMVDDLRKKNWAAFSRKYNGASYARRGYHTRMAAAYKKYSSR